MTTGYPNGSHRAGSTKINNPTSTPASDGCMLNAYLTAIDDNEHPQPLNRIHAELAEERSLEVDKPGLHSMHFSTGTDQ